MHTSPMQLDRKLYQDYPFNYNHVAEIPDLFGVEIELEGKNIKNIGAAINELWGQHNDGSLRIIKAGGQAIEYVFRNPYTFEMTKQALKLMFDFLNSNGVEVYPSYRTSIHVHVNCAAETYRTIYNFITLSIIFDELFVSQNGEHRIGNNFCLRARDAQGQVGDLVASIKQFGGLVGINANNRYSSINFASLTKFGTVEFRSLECTTDYDRVLHWVETINRLKTVARQFGNPQDIISYFSRNSAQEFLYFVLGAHALKYAKVPEMERMLLDGMRLAQDFAYCSEWKLAKPDDVIKPVKPKGKKMPYPVDIEQQHGWQAVPQGGIANNHMLQWVFNGNGDIVQVQPQQQQF